MIIEILALVGAGYGGWTALKRNGNHFDISQFAVVYGIAFALVGLFITIYLERAL